MINEIVSKFSFIGSLKPQEDFNANLQSSIKLMGGMALGIQAAAAGMFWWASSVISGVAPLVDLQREIGVATGAMQELGYAASQNGSDLNAVTSSMKNLNDKVQEFEKFGSGSAAEAAAYLGVSFRDASGNMKKADVIMDDVRRNMQGMSDAERLKIMDKLGIDASLLRTMKLTNSEMESLRSRAQALGVTTSEDADAVEGFAGAMTDLKFAMGGIQQMVAISFAPMMTGLVESFVDLLVSNRDWIVNGLQWLGGVVTSTAGFLQRMWPVLLGLAAAFVVLKIATFGWGAALAVVFSPVVLIVAAVAAVILIIDDLMVAMSGGQSVIADFFMEFFGVDIVPIIQGLIDAFVWLSDEIKAIFAPLEDFFKALFGFWSSIFSGEWGAALDHFVDAFAAIGELLSNIFNAWFDIFTVAWSSIGDFIGDVFVNAFEGIKNIWSSVVDWLKQKALDILPVWAVKLITGGVDLTGAAVDKASETASYVVDKASEGWSAVKGWFGGGDKEDKLDEGGFNPEGTDYSQITYQQQVATMPDLSEFAHQIAPLTTGSNLGDEGQPTYQQHVTTMPDLSEFAYQLPGQPQIEPTVNDSSDEMLDRATGGSNSTSSVEQEVQMNIYTSDAVAAGQAAADSLNEQLQDAQMMASRGGR